MYGKGILKSLGVSLKRFAETYLDDLRWIGKGKVISKKHDFWGAFDIITMETYIVRLIQVTTEDGRFERRTRLEEWIPRWQHKIPVVARIELWWWKGGRLSKRSRLEKGWHKEVAVWSREGKVVEWCPL